MITKYISLERLIHSIKTVTACLLGFVLAKLVGLSAAQWIIITIIVVMCAQIYVGSVIQKAYLRFLGTLIGCLFATGTLLLAGNSNVAIASAIALSSFIFSFIATWREDLTYACTLGAVTTAIIMLSQHPTLIIALERFLEISIGLLIATLVSQFILPIHARTHLRAAQAETIKQLQNYYLKTIQLSHTDITQVDYIELDEKIVKSLLRQRQLAKESKREPLGAAFNPAHFTQTLYCEREMLRAITFMHTALLHVTKAAEVFTQSLSAKTFNENIIKAFDTFIQGLEAEDQLPHLVVGIPKLSPLREAFANNIGVITTEEQHYLNGFLFSAEMLTDGLARLAKLYHIKIAMD